MTKASHIELYGNLASPFVRHCRIALIEESIDFTLIQTTPSQSTSLSAMQKIPLLRYQDASGNVQQLSDSSAILMFIRGLAGKNLFASALDYNIYCQANTIADSAINLFVLGKTGVTPDNNPYLARQQSRIHTGLAELNAMSIPTTTAINDSWLRVACMVDWLAYRSLVDISAYGHLQQLVAMLAAHSAFSQTTPEG